MLLSRVCLLITGLPLPDGIFDDYFFYQLRSKKKISGTLLGEVKQIGKHTPYQLAILGIPADESRSCVEKIFNSKKFSDYFFEEGRPSYISILSDPLDYDVSVTLYFEDEESMFEAGHRIYQNGTHPKKGYKLHPRKIGSLSTCSHCGKFCPLVSEKYRVEPRRFANMETEFIQYIKNDSDKRCVCMPEFHILTSNASK